MMHWKDVYVLLPTLNEEEGLKLVLEELRRMNFPMNQVFILDGHSTDGTVDVAKRFEVRNIIFQEGKGKGMAFQTFLKRVNVKDSGVYVMLDADYSYNPREIEKMVDVVNEGWDVVAGRRKLYVWGFRGFLHILGNFMISVVAAILTRRFFSDICTGYWAFRGKALKRMEIKARGFELEANIFLEVVRKRLKFKSVRVDYRERAGKRKLRMSDGLRILWFMIKEVV